MNATHRPRQHRVLRSRCATRVFNDAQDFIDDAADPLLVAAFCHAGNVGQTFKVREVAATGIDDVEADLLSRVGGSQRGDQRAHGHRLARLRPTGDRHMAAGDVQIEDEGILALVVGVVDKPNARGEHSRSRDDGRDPYPARQWWQPHAVSAVPAQLSSLAGGLNNSRQHGCRRIRRTCDDRGHLGRIPAVENAYCRDARCGMGTVRRNVFSHEWTGDIRRFETRDLTGCGLEVARARVSRQLVSIGDAQYLARLGG